MNAVRTDEDQPPPCMLCEKPGHPEEQCPLREPTDALLRAAAQTAVDTALLARLVARRTTALAAEAAQPVAVAIVVQDPEGRVLAMERADLPGQIVLPGGPIDKGETPEQAAQRQLLDTTGLRARRLRLVLTERAEPTQIKTACFEVMMSSGEPVSRQTPVSWVNWAVLTDPRLSSFAVFYERVRQAIGAEP